MTDLYLIGAGGWSEAMAEDTWAPAQLGFRLFGPQDGPPLRQIPVLLVYPTPQDLESLKNHDGPLLAWPGVPGLPQNALLLDPWPHHEVFLKARKILREGFLNRLTQWHARTVWVASQPPPADWLSEPLRALRFILGQPVRLEDGFSSAAAAVHHIDGAGDYPLGSIEALVTGPDPEAPGVFPWTLTLDVTGSLGMLHLYGVGGHGQQGPLLSIYRRAHRHEYMTLEHRPGVALLKAAARSLGH